MKSAFVLVVLCMTTGCNSSKPADGATALQAYESSVREHVSEFLSEAADARMMDMLEGEQAVKKGTTPQIKEYGRLMIKDHKALLIKIKALAAERGITLPARISDKKQDGLQTLIEKEGTAFDDKFIRMMIIDHERDVEAFKDAIKLKDKEVSKFASLNLPIIESHLAKAKAIQH